MAPEGDHLEAGIACVVVFCCLLGYSILMPPSISLLSWLLRVWLVIYAVLGLCFFLPIPRWPHIDLSSLRPASPLPYLVVTSSGPTVFQMFYSQVPAFACIQASLCRSLSPLSFLSYLLLIMPLGFQAGCVYIGVQYSVTELMPITFPLSIYLSSLSLWLLLLSMSHRNLPAQCKKNLHGYSSKFILCFICQLVAQILPAIAVAAVMIVKEKRLEVSVRLGHISLQCAVALLHPSLLERLFARNTGNSAEQSYPEQLIIATEDKRFPQPHSRVYNIDDQGQWDELDNRKYSSIRVEDPGESKRQHLIANLMRHVAAEVKILLQGRIGSNFEFSAYALDLEEEGFKVYDQEGDESLYVLFLRSSYQY